MKVVFVFLNFYLIDTEMFLKNGQLIFITMNKYISILAGLVLLVGAILLWHFTIGLGFWDFGSAAWEFLKGGAVWLVILVGVVLVAVGISEIKE